MLPHPFAFLTLHAGCALVAQEPAAGAGKPPTRPENRVEQRSQSMREQIGTGRQVQSHVRVAVRLKNGNRLTGVVKDGRLVERVDGLRFVDAQARDAGAGIRIWYSGNGRNYVFVPFADFAEYEVLQRLTGKQLADIEQEMQLDEKRTAAAVAQQADAELATPVATENPGDGAVKPAMPAGEGAGKAKAAVPGGETDPKALLEQQRKWHALLAAYPPKDGWNKAKRDEIARRFVVVGAKPSENEQKFVDEFDEWEKACVHFDAVPKPAAAGGDAGATGKGKSKSKTRGAKAEAAPAAGEEGAADPAAGKSKRGKQ